MLLGGGTPFFFPFFFVDMGIHTCTHASHIYFTLEKNVETNIGINKLTLYQTPSRGHIDPINLPGTSTKQFMGFITRTRSDNMQTCAVD
jgi:hypothetical protein